MYQPSEDGNSANAKNAGLSSHAISKSAQETENQPNDLQDVSTTACVVEDSQTLQSSHYLQLMNELQSQELIRRQEIISEEITLASFPTNYFQSVAYEIISKINATKNKNYNTLNEYHGIQNRNNRILNENLVTALLENNPFDLLEFEQTKARNNLISQFVGEMGVQVESLHEQMDKYSKNIAQIQNTCSVQSNELCKQATN